MRLVQVCHGCTCEWRAVLGAFFVLDELTLVRDREI
jgi:hypothetical protein